jgi:acetyl esterase/lipase
MLPSNVALFLSIFSLLTPALGQQMSVQEILELPQPAADDRISYGDDALQFGDLYLPKGRGPFPILVFIHGGCWYSKYTLSHVSSLAEDLSRIGIAVWSIEYRKSGDPGGSWPSTYLDVALGVDYVKKLLGQFPLDPGRIVIAGHSAGGYLALWAGSRSRLDSASPLYVPEPLEVDAVVALAGAGNMRQVAEAGLCGEAVTDIMGGKPDQVPDNYRDASPELRLPLGVQQFLVFGEEDPIVRLEYGRDYVDKALTSGDSVELIVLTDAGHFEMIAPATDEFDRVRDLFKRLLKTH